MKNLSLMTLALAMLAGCSGTDARRDDSSQVLVVEIDDYSGGRFHGWRSRLTEEDDFKTPRRQELFPLMAGKPDSWLGGNATVRKFDAQGRPVPNDAGLDGCEHQLVQLADLNGDGVCERVDLVSSLDSGGDAFSVLCISPLRSKAVPCLVVLFNWQTDDWGCQLADADGDGVCDIEFGPWRAGEIGAIDAQAVYRWDKTQKAYIGPDGQPGQHFQRLPNGSLSLELPRLEKAGKIFMANAKAEAEKKEKLSRPQASPYHYASLKSLTNQQIAGYMDDRNKNLDSFFSFLAEGATEKIVPETFWTMDPKSAAVAIAFRSLKPEMRSITRIAIDDRDVQKPPESGTLDFSRDDDTCYSLHFSPKGSWLFYAKNDPRFSCFDPAPELHRRTPILDLRRCEIPYPEARHLAQTVWWLQRIRSSGDGHSLPEVEFDPPRFAKLVWHDGQGRLVSELAESLQLRQWGGSYQRCNCLELTGMLIDDVLPSHLGARWRALELKHEQESQEGDLDRMVYEIEDLKKLHGFARQFLDQFSLDQSTISFPVVTTTVEVARKFDFFDLMARLEEIRKSLPAPSQAVQAAANLEAEIDRIEMAAAGTPSSAADKKKLEELRERHYEIVLDADTRNLESLREQLDSTLASWREHEGVPELQKLARQADDEFYKRTLQRFQKTYRASDAEALESMFQNLADEYVLADLIEKAPERADKLIRTMSPEKSPIGTVAFAFLSKSPKEIPHQAEWLQAMLAAISDPELGDRAIKALVPDNQPRRFSDPRIDEALLKLLRQFPTPPPPVAAKPREQNGPYAIPVPLDLSDSEVDMEKDRIREDAASLATEAALALARRGRSDCFDTIAAAYASLDEKIRIRVQERLWLAMVSLAQQNPVQIKPRLKKIFLPEFDRCSWEFDGMVSYMWMADLRDLKPDLEKCANSGPEDESHQGYSSQTDDGKYVGLERRLHIARKVVALWNEEDPATRGRLLLAFGLFRREFSSPEHLFRMKSELAQLEPVLTPADKQVVAGFLAWYREKYFEKLDPEERESKEQFISMAREQLKLP